MSGRHIALVVEDEPAMAREIASRLRTLGHDSVIVHTKAEAAPHLEKGGFCYALIDLELPTDEEDAKFHITHASAGLALVQEMRDRYAGRNRTDYLLPIIVMSGHAKDDKYVYDALKKRHGDAFVKKPFAQADPSLDQVIHDCLEQSGRQDHADCERLTVDATRARAATGSRPRIRLDVTGRCLGRRNEILIASKTVLLGNASFSLLLAFLDAFQREAQGEPAGPDGGGINIKGMGERGYKAVSRLNAELAPYLEDDGYERRAVVNAGDGRYGLDTRAIEVGTVDWKKLATHPSEQVKKALTQRRERTAKAAKR